jgi:hypothetical protein
MVLPTLDQLNLGAVAAPELAGNPSTKNVFFTGLKRVFLL